MNICCINCPPFNNRVFGATLQMTLIAHIFTNSACFIVTLVERISAPDRAQIILSDGYIVKGAKESVVSRCFYLCMYTCCICVFANIFLHFCPPQQLLGLVFAPRHLKLVFAAGVLLFFAPFLLLQLCICSLMLLYLNIIAKMAR